MMALAPGSVDRLAVAEVGTNHNGDVTPEVAVTLDGGASWYESRVSSFDKLWARNSTVSPVWGNASVLYVASAAPTEPFGALTRPRLARSNDAGKTWKTRPASAAAANALPSVPVTRMLVDPRSVDVLYIANWLGVYVSSDAGFTWARLGGAALPNVQVSDLNLVQAGGALRLRVATRGRGVWEIPLA